jgi:hypothetical protein
VPESCRDVIPMPDPEGRVTTRVIEVSLPPSDRPRKVTIEYTGPAEAADSLLVRTFHLRD